jgi:arginine deiminase
MISEAIRFHSSFNIIHLETFFKVDIFVSKDREFDQMEMARRELYSFSTETDQKIYIASAEDTILSKLEWYRMGGEISDRQWNDILGIIKVQKGKLDHEYLYRGAKLLEVGDLLNKALQEG